MENEFKPVCSSSKVSATSVNTNESFEVKPPTSPFINSNQVEKIHPCFFQGLIVRVNIANEQLSSLISNSLSKLGSKVITNTSQNPDAVIIDNSQDQSYDSIEKKLTQFIRYARGTKVPKIIPLSKIPWVLSSSPFQHLFKLDLDVVGKSIQRKENININAKTGKSKDNIVISDANHKYKPVFGRFKELSLDFKPVPKNYLYSPFTPVPDDPDELQEMIEKPRRANHQTNSNPNEPGYCAICNKNYINGSEHRSSIMHIDKVVNSNIFSMFDIMISQINKL